MDMRFRYSIQGKAAQAASLQILQFMLENEYIDSDIVEEIKESGDIEHINDIAHYHLSVSCAMAIALDKKQAALQIEKLRTLLDLPVNEVA